MAMLVITRGYIYHMGLLRPWPIHPCLISPFDSSQQYTRHCMRPQHNKSTTTVWFPRGFMNLIQERDHVTFSAKDQPRFHLTNSQWTGPLGAMPAFSRSSGMGDKSTAVDTWSSTAFISTADLMCFLGHFFSSRPTWSLVLGACLGFSIHGPRKTTSLCQVISSAIQLHPTAGGLRNCLNLVFESCSAYLVVNQKWNPKWDGLVQPRWP